MVIHTRIYKTSTAELGTTNRTTIRTSRGIDWILEEGGHSYSILEQVSDASGQMIMKLLLRPKDWTGPIYLDTVEEEVEIVKQDSKSIWIRQKGLEYVHWYSDVRTGFPPHLF
jgi:hypothetical protein